MKLGLGLYDNMLTAENFRFARQAGATHVVAHIPALLPKAKAPAGCWGVTDPTLPYWTYEDLRDLRAAANAEGVDIAALENFPVPHWHDVLLDGPRKQAQLENLKISIRNLGKAGIPVMGYNFSLAGVWGRVRGPFGRGGAESIGYLADQAPPQDPIPNGTIWNTVYDKEAPPGPIAPVTEEALWQRLSDFLTTIVPVAEEAGVRLAAHPDDPPLPVLRQTPRLVYTPDRYQRLLDIVPSYYNALEFCQGTIAEMAVGDVYEAIDTYSAQGKIAYVHFRNVVGKVPNYTESFVDDGDVDMIQSLRIYHKNGYDGVIIPDHTPHMSCAAGWHAGMAFALGWMKAVVTMLERGA
ncbi:MAG: D-mannonate dehydratase [Caldilinea sp. CFX5]|nr:D-mannonate dehydratase [Caldilinea sp. CFX5]